MKYMFSSSTHRRGRPWRYSVIPSTLDFRTEYQICRSSNPAGIPVFAAIWGPYFRPNTIILTNMFKQIKQIRITLMAMFKVNTSPPNEVPGMLIRMRRCGTRGSVALFILGRAWLHAFTALCCVLGRCGSRLPNLLIATKSTVSVLTELKLPGHHVWKTQASEMPFACLRKMRTTLIAI